ncbi:nuclear transport factor 2 family protein [Vibrio sp. WXL103]|uniref:nuclear transport factor 2 family protein n=1 Tax=Vibrio sp. WXL103 TaxID=3450710 RepID=UPI003EC9332C
MKRLLEILLTFGVMTMPISAQTISRDTAEVSSVIHSFSSLADQGAFEYLGRLFTPTVVLDYTSLFAGEVTQVSREALMVQWAGFLPGFDTTYHQLGDMKVKLDTHNAKVLVDVTATHWLDEQFWQIKGTYDFGLVNTAQGWQITSIVLSVSEESGTRTILELAPNRARQNHSQRQSLLLPVTTDD